MSEPHAAALTGHSGAIDPDLPMPVFVSSDRWHPERIRALALYCSDGRWGEAFDEFCHRHLLIPRYDRWAVPGGPAWVAAHEDSREVIAAREQLNFLVNAHELERIILITHYGCAFYGHQLGWPPRDCLAQQIEDVRIGAERLRGWFKGIEVQGYLAMRSNCLTFHALEA